MLLATRKADPSTRNIHESDSTDTMRVTQNFVIYLVVLWIAAGATAVAPAPRNPNTDADMLPGIYFAVVLTGVKWQGEAVVPCASFFAW